MATLQEMASISEISRPESLKSDLRRRAILDVARAIFLQEGYAAASMSNIAARLGGSKGTLYNYFRSKEELFAAFMTDMCAGVAQALFDNLPDFDGELRPALIKAGEAFVGLILSDPLAAIQRLVIGEAGRFPELGRIFYENGPKRGETRLGDYFQGAIDAGLLRPGDPLAMGKRFKQLVIADLQDLRLWGVLGEPTAEEIHARVAEGVDIFLTAYAAEPVPAR
jgi:AcrR family transcriptional regulator